MDRMHNRGRSRANIFFSGKKPAKLTREKYISLGRTGTILVIRSIKTMPVRGCIDNSPPNTQRYCGHLGFKWVFEWPVRQ